MKKKKVILILTSISIIALLNGVFYLFKKEKTKENIEQDLNITSMIIIDNPEARVYSDFYLIETEEGITIESECIGKVYSPEEYDKNEWTVYGEPDTTIVVARPATVELTCASIVNRIPDVINSIPGYVTTDKFGELNYRTKPLNEYVK